MSEPIYKQCEVCRRSFRKGDERHYVCPDCSNKDYSHLVGETMRTPWEPDGLVTVLRVEEGRFGGKQSVVVEYMEQHPNGYGRGTHGRYFAHELRPIQEQA